MLNKWAIVRQSDNVVVNVCIWDGNTDTWSPPDGCFVISLEDKVAGPGWIWDGTSFSDPAQP